jgi:hypothetical protein
MRLVKKYVKDCGLIKAKKMPYSIVVNKINKIISYACTKPLRECRFFEQGATYLLSARGRYQKLGKR